MNETVEESESALAAYGKACDLKNTCAEDAQRLYIEANCVTWLSDLLKEYRRSQTFSFETPASEDAERYRELTVRYGFQIADMESVMKAALEGRPTIRPDTGRAKRKKTVC